MPKQAKYRKDYQTPDFTITDVALDFQLDPNNTLVTATSQVKRLKDSKTLTLDGQGFELVSVKLNGEKLTDYELTKTALSLLIPADLQDFTLEIQTLLVPAKNTSLQGLYQSGEALCTQCEAEGFRQITYFLDRPDVLARYTTKITANKTAYPYLLSNGNRIASGELPDGKHWVEWQDPFPKPCYLFALVAGQFDVLEDTFTTKSGRQVKLELFVDVGNLDRADFAMESLKKAMKWDEDRFGLEYDLDIYMIVAVDFFNMGAMENKGLNIFNSKYVLANPQTATDDDYLGVESVIGHEYFHNWTGNRVTCRDWFQLSLKEGLTVFRDQEFSSDVGSRAVNRINNVNVLRAMQFPEDASPMSHPIRPEKVVEMNNFYTMTVYEKGAEVIRMMHTLLGEDNFQAGMRLYIAENDGKAATCDDFVSAMERASGVDLTLFRKWYSQSGTPVLTVRDTYDVATQTYQLTVEQHTPATADQTEKDSLHIPLKIALYDVNGKKFALDHDVLDVKTASQTFTFNHIDSQPIPALLCDFSAPVKLHYDYTMAQLITLMQFAENEFVRWDATQMLFNQVLKANLTRFAQGEALQFPAEFLAALKATLQNAESNEAIAALILALPSAMTFAETVDVIDPVAIVAVRDFMQQQISDALQQDFYDAYKKYKADHYVFSQEAVAHRALRNLCLSYLAFTRFGESLVTRHYYESDNMTDTLAALKAAAQAKLATAETLLTDFEEKWAHDGLVMDKWFAIQASRPDSAALTRVKNLLNHRSFSMQNPNRVRSLIGAFSVNNLAQFHVETGEGYAFLRDILLQLNETNPQVASRLIEPLIRFNRYDENRQGLMKEALQHLRAEENLSPDLSEKIEKALTK